MTISRRTHSDSILIIFPRKASMLLFSQHVDCVNDNLSSDNEHREQKTINKRWEKFQISHLTKPPRFRFCVVSLVTSHPSHAIIFLFSPFKFSSQKIIIDKRKFLCVSFFCLRVLCHTTMREKWKTTSRNVEMIILITQNVQRKIRKNRHPKSLSLKNESNFSRRMFMSHKIFYQTLTKLQICSYNAQKNDGTTYQLTTHPSTKSQIKNHLTFFVCLPFSPFFCPSTVQKSKVKEMKNSWWGRHSFASMRIIFILIMLELFIKTRA